MFRVLQTVASRPRLKALLPVRAAFSASASADKDVIELLSKEHREALDKLQQLYITTEPDLKRKLTNILITDLIVHDVTEEIIVYPFLADKIPDGVDVKKINADEHEEMEETLRDLESADCEKPEPFYAIVKSLTAILDRHRIEEEQGTFVTLRKVTDRADLISMATKAEALKKLAPTPPTETTLNLVDKTRAALTSKAGQ